MPSMAPTADPAEIYAWLQRAYMAGETTSILDDVAGLGRLMAVTDVPIADLVEIHGRVLAEELATAPPDRVRQQIDAAGTCLAALIVSWQGVSDSLAHRDAPESCDGGAHSPAPRPPRFARFLADGAMEADGGNAPLLRSLAGGVAHATLDGWLTAVAGPDWAAEVRQAVEQRRIVVAEFPVLGANIHHRVVVFPFRDGGGIVGVRDITAMVMARDAGFQRRKLESLGRFAGGMAHEVNNLLQPIVSVVQMTLEDYGDDSGLSQDMSVVLDCVRRAAEIIRGVMVFVRHTPPDLARFALRGAVAEELGMVRATLPPALTVTLRVAPGADAAVVGNRRELGQILQNLVANARDAVGGQGVVTVDLGDCVLDGAEAARFQVAAGRYARVAVTDHGTGIEPTHLDRVFEPFYTTKGIGKGTGLGLPIVRGIVRSWRGGIAVKSKAGLGTTFEIVLPSAPCAARPAERT